MAGDADVVVRDLAGTMVLELHGVVDRGVADQLTKAYEQGRADAPARVVLDFSDTEYINSSGIALIVSILGRARSEGLNVAAFGLSDHYRHIFDITRLSDFIDVCPDLDTALMAPGQRR
ncbi:MAG TPA: STAS domain-containing protein [Acidimicrobiales bacterium]|nr:STAS domain-containing protein [Acidimicrobiales bacterium]